MTIDEKIEKAAEENYKSIPWQFVNNQSFHSVHRNAFSAGAEAMKFEMLADMQKLAKALEFYADKLNWRTNSGKIGITPLTNGCDAEIIDRLFTGGKRARQALAEFNAKYKGEK